MNSPNAPAAAVRASEIGAQLESLLRMRDDEFVYNAYAVLLGRQPDPDGLANFRRRLRDGIARVRILEEIAGSPEARAKGVQLISLKAALLKTRLASLPVIGEILGCLIRAESDDGAARAARGLIYKTRESMRDFEAFVADAEGRIGDLLASARNGERTRPTIETPSGDLPLPPPAARSVPSVERTIYCYVDHTIGYPLNSGIQRVARQVAASLLGRQERVRFVKWDARIERLVLLTREDMPALSAWGGADFGPDQLHYYPEAAGAAVPIEFSAVPGTAWLLVPEVTHITDHPSPVTVGVIAEAKAKGLKTAFVFFDATPLRRAELESMAARHVNYMEALALADLVLPISQSAADDFLSFMGCRGYHALGGAPSIVTVPLPGEPPKGAFPIAFGTKAATAVSEPIILCVGTVTWHKNQVTLVRAFEAFCARHPDTKWRLVIAGNVHADLEPEVARARKAMPNIAFVRHVSDIELDSLYRRCAFTVFPSVEEGFGLPIMESLRYGKPCICANFGAMAEIAAGGGCVTVDTRDAAALASALENLASSPDLLTDLAAAGSRRAFGSWRGYVDAVVGQMAVLDAPCHALGTIYYWVDHTRTYHGNSGIQRVVRALARALLEMGADLVGVRWNSATARLEPADRADLEHLERWNGPPADAWRPWREPGRAGGWLLLPELTSYLPQAEMEALRSYLTVHRLRGAWIFYDTIPWKMPEIYPPAATAAHRAYMTALAAYDLVLPISEFSFADLVRFLAGELKRTPGLFERVIPCSLPGEFIESRRVLEVKEKANGPVRVLCVGTVEPRKNHLLLIAAFRQVLAECSVPTELVLAGSGVSFPELAVEVRQILATEPRIRWVESPGEAELHTLYAECDLTVYPSLEEGFGLPILESLWHARPCVCASFGAMAEVARGGGCLGVDVRDASDMATALKKLIEDDELRLRLAKESTARIFRTWRDYAQDVAQRMRAIHEVEPEPSPIPVDAADRLAAFVNLPPRPRLSICISTYQRADWLALSLRNLARIWPDPSTDVEILICDNASTDGTAEVVKPYLTRADVRYVQNPRNVGMLGNMRVTAHASSGDYVWILGDDDTVVPGAIEKVLSVINAAPAPSLAYLNYSYTLAADPQDIDDLDKFIGSAIPVSKPGPDLSGQVRDIGAKSENFFTGIYCLVFRRDHALRAYTQNIEGEPFSSLLTCVPMAWYVLNYMIDEPAVWVGHPQLVANMNVSWSRYASPYVLEQLPQVRDLAERQGIDGAAIDEWRLRSFPMVFRYFSLLFDRDYPGNFSHVSLPRILSRLRGHQGIGPFVEPMKAAYRTAQLAGHPAARTGVDEMFAGF